MWFQGRSADEIEAAFAESVEDYLAFCEERAKKLRLGEQ